jgi:hypothetical protein
VTVSEKQLAANRANAKKSTGPRTPQGKARSSLNALAHGLRARRPVLPNEDRRQFDAFARGLRRDLRPNGPLQALLVEQVIEAAWKLQRAESAQGDVVRHALARYAGNARRISPGKLLADAIGGDPWAEPYLNLEQYTERLQRSFFTALRRLHRAQKQNAPSTSEPISVTGEEGEEFAASPVARAGYERHSSLPRTDPAVPVPPTNPFSPVFPAHSPMPAPTGTG